MRDALYTASRWFRYALKVENSPTLTASDVVPDYICAVWLGAVRSPYWQVWVPHCDGVHQLDLPVDNVY